MLKNCLEVDIWNECFGIADGYFLSNKYRVNLWPALDRCSKLHFAQYLLNKFMDFDQLLCNHMYLLVCLLITFANRLDPDQARHSVRPDLDPNCLIL